jgi:hypothetical protein
VTRRRPWLDFDPSDPASWMLSSSPSRSWPTTAAQMAAAMGYGTWASLWQCDEASGNLTDVVGGVTLTANSTPTYRTAGAFSGDFAIGFDSAADRFEGGDVYDSDGTTDIAAYCCVYVTANSAFNHVMGKGIAAGQPFWGIIANAGTWLGYVSDGATNQISTGPAVATGQWLDVLMCLDRTADTVQIFVGASAGTDQSTAANATAANANPFYLGGAAAFAPPSCLIAFAAVATGGVATLKTNGLTALANIKRWTGR